jgi:hypothetical protein
VSWDGLWRVFSGAGGIEGGLWNFLSASHFIYHAVCIIPEKTLRLSGGCPAPCHKKFCCLHQDQEGEIVLALIADLNINFGVKHEPSPSMEGGAVTQGEKTEGRRYSITGGSHMNKMVPHMSRNLIMSSPCKSL